MTEPTTPAASPTDPAPKPQRGKGYIRNTKDRTIGPIALLLGAAALAAGMLPESSSMVDVLDKIDVDANGVATKVHNQKATSSCVGWAFAECIAIRMAAAHAPIPFPSAQGIYTCARGLQRKDPASGGVSVALVDEGSMPDLAVQGMREYGTASATSWPFDPEKINDEPTWGELEAASAFIVNGTYGITDNGKARITAVRQAIAKKFPVAGGTDVDQLFEDCDGTYTISAPRGEILGGHMIELIAYEPNPEKPGEYRFLLLNHWGDEDWGQHTTADLNGARVPVPGLAWVDEAFVDALVDLFALDIVPPAAAA